MSKFLEKGKLCLYLDHFGACRIFVPAPPAEWAELAAVIKQGIKAEKFLCPYPFEQIIEGTDMDKKSAISLDSETHKFSSGWRFFSEAEISANYLICRVRQSKIKKKRFITKSESKVFDNYNSYEKLSEINETFRQMIDELAQSVNVNKKVGNNVNSRSSVNVRNTLVTNLKDQYAQDLLLRLYVIKSGKRYFPQPVTLAGKNIHYWADVICILLTTHHRINLVECRNAYEILERDGLDAIPSLSIRASLEAMQTYKNTLQTPNDQVDILRIAEALPFADIMLIDRSKANDVRELKLDVKYRTEIFSGKQAERNNLTTYLSRFLTL